MYKYLLEPRAQQEYEEAIEWYAERSEAATLNFIKEMDETIVQICEKPHANKKPYNNFYETTLDKYPFTIVYVIEPNQKLIVIVSVYHQKRNPKYKYKVKKK